MKLYIQEFQNNASDQHGWTLTRTPQMPPIAEEVIDFSDGQQHSRKFHSLTKFVLLHTDHDCQISFGDDPEITKHSCRLAKNETRYYGVIPLQRVVVKEL